MAGLLTLPYDLLLSILDFLKAPSGSTLGAAAILNLSLSCRGLYSFVSWYAGATLSPAKRRVLYDISPISAMCRHVGNICGFCSNRARHSEHGEVFTGLRLCHACETRRIHKISATRLWSDYTTADGDKDQVNEILNGLERIVILSGSDNATPSQTLYLWENIEPLISDRTLRLNQRIVKSLSDNLFSLEELGYFNIYSATTERSLRLKRHHFEALTWAEIVAKWGRNGTLPTSPLETDLLLYTEFRYRFDSLWEGPFSDLEWRNEYLSYSKYWASSVLWEYRPWRLRCFPCLPRNSVSNPFGHKKEDDECEFKRYQEQCSYLRSIIKIFPDILRAPATWNACTYRMRTRKYAKGKEVAAQAATSWKPSPGKVVFEIIGGAGGETDVIPRLWNVKKRIDIRVPPMGLRDTVPRVIVSAADDCFSVWPPQLEKSL